MDAYTPPQQYATLVENEESVAKAVSTQAASNGIATYAASTKAPSIYFNTGSATYPKIYVNTSTSLKNLYFKIS